MSRLTNTTICVVVASLAGAGGAAADVHIDKGRHGGRPLPTAVTAAASSVPFTLGGQTQQHQPVAARVSRRAIAVNAAYLSKCLSGGDPSFSSALVPPAKVGRHGSYSLKRTTRMHFSDGYMLKESYKLAGRLAKGRTSGTLSIHDVWYDPNGRLEDSCDSGKLRFKLFHSGVYAGATDEGDPVVLEYSPGRDRVNSLLIPWTMKCNSGNWVWDTADLSSPIDTSGAFGGTLTPTMDWGEGRQAQETQALAGMLGRRGAFGTWSVSASVVDATQAPIDSCETGARSFVLS